MESDANMYLEQLKKDPIQSVFLSENFNLQNAMSLINNLPFSEQISKISHCIDQIKSSIGQLTSKNSEFFFRQAAKLDELYDELRSICLKAQNLSKTLDLMKAKFDAPHQQLMREIRLLARLQKTCDLLRKMLRIMHLMERIEETNLDHSKREPSVFMKEIIKLSQYVNEIDGIILSDAENLLPKLNLIKNDLVKFNETKDRLNVEVDVMLKSGLDSLDLNSISTALQVYHNLRILEPTVQGLIHSKCQLIQEAASKLFEEIAMKESKVGVLSSRQNLFRTAIRSEIKLMLETVLVHYNQISTVIKVLRKRRDNATQTLLIDLLPQQDQDLMKQFWQQVIHILTETFDRLFKESPMIRKLIESDYPKILAVFLDYSKRIMHEDDEENAMVESEQIKPLRSAMGQFENAYLSNSLSLLFESVNRIFTSVENVKNQKIDSVPSEKEVDAVIKDIGTEILSSAFDPVLAEAVCGNIVKTIKLFALRCEQLVLTDGDATQVIDKFTTNQRHNSLIIYILNYFGVQLRNLFSQDDSCMKPHLENSLESLRTLIGTIFEPFILSVQEAIEDIILTIHNENYDLDDNVTTIQCSLYMKELQRFISRVSQDYFQQFPVTEIITERIHRMTAYVIDFFLLQNCLVRPVSGAGRRRLEMDFTQLEVATTPICQRLGDLGRSFQILKAFKTLLAATPEEICRSPIIGDPVPLYLVVHFFISNYASPELKSPHRYQEWSVTRYTKWIMADRKPDGGDQDRLSAVRGAINDYVADAKRSQKKTYFPTYPLLVELLKK